MIDQYESVPRLAQLAVELRALARLANKAGLKDDDKLALLRIHAREVARIEQAEREEASRDYNATWYRPGAEYADI